MKSDELLAWIDIETTGLDILEDELLEVALIVTDQQDNSLHEQNWVIYNDGIHEDIHPIVMEMHTKSNLWEDCRESRLTLTEFERQFCVLLDKILRENPQYTKFVMAGSGVARFDYEWFKYRHPQIIKRFNYYTLDVGVIRRGLELAGILPRVDEENKVCNCDYTRDPASAYHSIFCPLRQDSLNHRALQDINDHFEEWLEYRELLNDLKML